jgi:two-component system LytT family response regulator
VKFIPAAAVDWIEADRNYIVLCVGDARHKVRGSLRDVITRLDRRMFARIHKSAIVNIDRIRELQPWFGGDYIAILRNGAKLKVSRRHVAALIRPMA